MKGVARRGVKGVKGRQQATRVRRCGGRGSRYAASVNRMVLENQPACP